MSLTGTSDPYVKFKLGGKEVFRSKTIHKNLNPVWEEKACILIDNPREPLYIKVRCCLTCVCQITKEELLKEFMFCNFCLLKNLLCNTALLKITGENYLNYICVMVMTKIPQIKGKYRHLCLFPAINV